MYNQVTQLCNANRAHVKLTELDALWAWEPQLHKNVINAASFSRYYKNEHFM